MDLSFQKRIAAKILKCGINRVWFDPKALEEISSASTKEDIRELIERGAIKRKAVKGVCRVRTRNRKRGPGSKKGKKTARMPRKLVWMIRIRALRRKLRQLKDSGQIDRKTYRILYRKAKGGEFRSIAHLELYLSQMRR